MAIENQGNRSRTHLGASDRRRVAGGPNLDHLEAGTLLGFVRVVLLGKIEELFFFCVETDYNDGPCERNRVSTGFRLCCLW
jgi:hypothetical protein